MSAEFLECAVAEGVGTITLSRPSALNALNEQLLRELRKTLAMWLTDPAVDVVIITGKGTKAFAAGADIAELAAKRPIELASATGMQECLTEIRSYPKPTIAAVNGFAFGGGFELALSCDIRLASEQAKLGLPELSLGIIPGAGGTQLLTRLAGAGSAIYYVLTGLPMEAHRAHELGIVSEVVSADDLLPRAAELAQLIRAKGPLATQLAKFAIGAASGEVAAGLAVEKLAQAVAFASPDAREGMTAFLEKRPPHFTDEIPRKDGTVA